MNCILFFSYRRNIEKKISFIWNRELLLLLLLLLQIYKDLVAGDAFTAFSWVLIFSCRWTSDCTFFKGMWSPLIFALVPVSIASWESLPSSSGLHTLLLWSCSTFWKSPGGLTHHLEMQADNVLFQNPWGGGEGKETSSAWEGKS